LKKCLHIFLFFIVFPTILNAQYKQRNSFKNKRHEVNFGLGFSNCLTDVGGNRNKASINIKKTNFTANFSHLYQIQNKIAFRTSLTYAKVSGDDSYSSVYSKKNKALNFNTTISELSGILEFTITTLKNKNTYKSKNKRRKNIANKDRLGFGSYIFVGLGSFYYNPMGINKFLDSEGNNVGDGQKYSLRELHTEGQGFVGGPEQFSKQATGKKYSTYNDFAICVPIGFGIKKPFHSNGGIKLEASYRFTNTDYLDDVSSKYYDREKLRIEMNQAFNEELAQSAYIMSGTSTGSVNLTNTEPAEARGEKKGNDSYIFLTLSVYKTITNKSYKDK
jgi:hypothetical protein